MSTAGAGNLRDDEVFAAYGRAMHGAQALEYWLRILVTVSRTVSKSFASLVEVERAVETLSTATMGTVVASLRSFVDDPGLEKQLTHAVAERNRLAHKYFAEWSDRWIGTDTESLMIDDADRVRVLFEGTVNTLASALKPHLDTIGSDPDAYIPGLSQRVSELINRKSDGSDSNS